MAILRPAEALTSAADRKATRDTPVGHAARSERMIRDLLEDWAGQRWPDARRCHELVIAEGKVRADMVAISPDHMVAFEVKGSWDNTTRLLHQVGMYQLAVPEVWIVCAEEHRDDAGVIRHLLPSVGILVASGMTRQALVGREFIQSDGAVEVRAEAEPRDTLVEATLQMLWAAELAGACDALRVSRGTRWTRAKMIRALLERCEPDALRRAAYAQIRARDAQWRADPVVPVPSAGGAT